MRRPLKRLSFLRLLALVTLFTFFAGLGGVYHVYAEFAYDLPEDLTAMREAPSRSSRVYSADGELIGEFFLQKRVVVPLANIPDMVRSAFIAAEDGRFWEHPGFDPVGIARAAYSNFKGTGSQQGASTITQQLTRMLMLSNERTYRRKIREVILSIRVERELTKSDILEMYLNRVYLGRGAYGVQAAADVYFGKDVGDLTLAEAAMLAGLVQRPSDYSPHKNMEAARTRQRYVLGRMVDDGHIGAAARDAAMREPLGLVPDDIPLNHLAAPHFVEHVRKWAAKKFGHKSVFYGGLRIYTSLDMKMQRVAESAVVRGIDALDRKIGFRGPLGHLAPVQLVEFAESPPRPHSTAGEPPLNAGHQILPEIAYVAAVTKASRGTVEVTIGHKAFGMSRADSRWFASYLEKDEDDKGGGVSTSGKRRYLKVGDLIPVKLAPPPPAETTTKRRPRKRPRLPQVVPAQRPKVQAAFVALDPHTGRIEAMVGSYDYRESEFNRVTQAKRQIGSAFKPFIYATAMEQKHVHHLSIVKDAPITVRTAGGLWSPRNYTAGFSGAMTLRTALARSINTISVRLVLAVGVDKVIELARRVGLVSPIPRHISIALGTPDLTLLEVAAGYGTFANGGKRIAPQDALAGPLPGRFVDLVTTDDGEVLSDYRKQVPTEQVVSPELAYMVVDLMKVVVRRGTARKALAIGRPAAGKTGTSTGWRDAWFLGYTADLLAGVWVGRDDFLPISRRATGGGAALPIWVEFMRRAHPPTTPRDFTVPDSVVLVRANGRTGQPMAPGASSAAWVPFMRGDVPARFSRGVKPSQFGDTDRFTDRRPSKR